MVSPSCGPTHLDPEHLAHRQLNARVLPGHELIHAGASVQVWRVPVRGCTVLAAQVEEDGRAAERAGQSMAPAFPNAATPTTPAWPGHRRASGSDLLREEEEPKGPGERQSAHQSARVGRETCSVWELADGIRKCSLDREQQVWKYRAEKESGKSGERRW